MQENVGIDVLKNFQLYFVYETVFYQSIIKNQLNNQKPTVEFS